MVGGTYLEVPAAIPVVVAACNASGRLATGPSGPRAGRFRLARRLGRVAPRRGRRLGRPLAIWFAVPRVCRVGWFEEHSACQTRLIQPGGLRWSLLWVHQLCRE